MEITRSHSACAGEGSRRRGLAETVVTPSDDRAVAAQRQTVDATGGDAPNPVLRRGAADLTKGVIAPRGDRARPEQRQTVRIAGGHGEDIVARSRGDVALAVVIPAPRDGGAILQN